MSIWQRIRLGMARLMVGRHGSDELSLAILIAGLLISMIGGLLRIGLLQYISMAAYIYALWRMFSKQHAKRAAENTRYLAAFGRVTGNARQFFTRIRNVRKYKYFRCPECHARLRLPRGVGQVTITCGSCKHAFQKKA